MESHPVHGRTLIIGESSRWRSAIPLEDLDPGLGKLVRIDSKRIALFRVGDRVFATDNQCPHEGYPLSDGSLQDGVLTCNWHNWKFTLETGTCIFGGEDVRVYPTEIRDGVVFVDIKDPPSSKTIPRRRNSLIAAVEDMDTSRIARDVLRLIQMDVKPEDILFDAATYGAKHAEYGWNHALAVVTDCSRMIPGLSGMELGLPLTQAFRAVSEENLRQPPRPHSGPVGVEKYATTNDIFDAIRDNVEAGRLDDAEGLFRGAIEAGVPTNELARCLYGLATDHFLAFGHALIYVSKAFEMANCLGDRVIPAVFPALIPEIGYATREDLLPYMRATMRSMNGALAELPELVAKQTDPAAGFDEHRFRAVLLDGNQEETFLATHEALGRGVRVDRILDATVLAASERLLRFDPKKDWMTDKDYGWLDVTHNLTYANAVRKACRAMLNPDTLRSVYFATWFVNRTKKLDAAKENQVPLGNPDDPSISMESLDRAIQDHDLEKVVSVTRHLSRGKAGPKEVGNHLVRTSLKDRASVQIFVDHLIKTSMAAAEETLGLGRHPDAWLPLAATARFVAADRRERGIDRQVTLAMDFVYRGKPSETV